MTLIKMWPQHNYTQLNDTQHNTHCKHIIHNDTQYYDIQHETQCKDSLHNDSHHNDSTIGEILTLGKAYVNVNGQCHSAECRYAESRGA
jgi:imidazoleglycerol phosphate dehydratase HisB